MSTDNTLTTVGTGSPRSSSKSFILVVLLLGAIAGGVIIYSPRWYMPGKAKAEGPTLKTGGTSAIVVILQNVWRSKYLAEKKVDIICDSVGTEKGIKRMIDKDFSIAFTHAALEKQQLEEVQRQGNSVVHIPLLLCGVVPIYNVKELKGQKPVKFTGEVLANIFLGKITKWDDPALKALNPDLPLPAKDIKVIHRKDHSGTTLIFTEYLSGVSPAWREQMGKPADYVKWPLGEPVERSMGVASRVPEVDGSISYVDRLFTSCQREANDQIDFGAVQNADKTAFVQADPINMTAAAEGALSTIPDNLAFSMANRPGEKAYPISGVIYAVCLKKQPEANRAMLVDFLSWAVHKGQGDAEKMSFAPLPVELVKRVDKALESIQ